MPKDEECDHTDVQCLACGQQFHWWFYEYWPTEPDAPTKETEAIDDNE